MTGGDELIAWTRALGDPDRRVRQEAVRRLASAGPAIVPAVIRLLREEHRDFNILSSLVDLLATTRIDVVGPIIPLLQDPDADLRVQAALILGTRADARATPALVAALDDPDPNVCFHAVEALGSLRAREAVDRLLAIATAGDFFLAFPAIEALTRIGDPRAAPALVPLLADDLLRAAASGALGVLGDEMAVEPLVDTLQNPATPVDVIAEALAGLWERYESQYAAGAQIAAAVSRAIGPTGIQRLLDAVDQAAPEDLPAITRVLGWFRGPAVDRALTRLLGRASVRAQVVEALVRHGGRVLALLVPQLRAEDLETRQAAAVALGRIGDRRATAALADALGDSEVTIAAAGALARIGDPSAFEPLFCLLDHENAAVRTAAVAALNSIGHPEMPARIFDLLESPSPAARESAVKIAGYFAYPDCADRVLERCVDPVESVRRAAIEHAALFDHPGVLPALLHALRAESPANRAAAAAALAQVPRSEARHALRKALRDGDPWVRYFAARSLGTSGDSACAAPLEALLRHEPEALVRVATVEALGRLGGPGVLDIVQPLTQSADSDVARAAIRALGRLHERAAVERLVALMWSPDTWRREAAVHALGDIGGETAALTLQQSAARDEQPPVAGAAIGELARIASRPDAAAPRATQALVQLTDAPATRPAAIAALAGLPVSRMTDLRVAFEESVTDRRSALIEVFGRMRRPEATRILERALQDPAGRVRAAAIVELRRLGSSGATRALLVLAREDPDREVRQAAMLAMARQPVAAGDAHGDRK